MTADQEIEGRIDDLVRREQELRTHHTGRGLDADEQAELGRLELRLDQLWDLLRRRRADREFGKDPSVETLRDQDTVEKYLQ